jgi:DNA-binding transcriptional LysR family regulator
MPADLPPLNCLLAFDAVARRMSFSTAARDLHLTPSAISHQIARLEGFLGARLFERNARSISLTPAGQDYLRRVSGALDSIRAASGHVRQGVRNALHVHVSPSFASLWLMPRLSLFVREHPDIQLSLSASVVHSDFSAGQVDMDIRYGVPGWPNLTVECIFEESVLPLASPGFLARHAILKPEDLLRAPLIQSTVSVVQWTDWFSSRGVQGAPATIAYRFDRAQMALSAAEQGLGVALESSTIGESHLRARKLQPVFTGRVGIPVQAHYMVYPPHHAQRLELQHFIDWLRAQAAAGRRVRRR